MTRRFLLIVFDVFKKDLVIFVVEFVEVARAYDIERRLQGLHNGVRNGEIVRKLFF